MEKNIKMRCVGVDNDIWKQIKVKCATDGKFIHETLNEVLKKGLEQ